MDETISPTAASQTARRVVSSADSARASATASSASLISSSRERI
jgi:hypothetical protein